MSFEKKRVSFEKKRVSSEKNRVTFEIFRGSYYPKLYTLRTVIVFITPRNPLLYVSQLTLLRNLSVTLVKGYAKYLIINQYVTKVCVTCVTLCDFLFANSV